MILKFDMAEEVAVANSRTSKSWKNKKMKWSEVVERFSHTITTPETVAEYRKLSKQKQADIKDVGAFVGGYCANGSRTDVKSRWLLALDADYASGDLWDDWGLLYGNAAAVYSTHKHTPDKPRLRLVIPLSRSVGPDEYQAVSRKVAERLGIDQFDDSTYQPQRCMFWPSTSIDGEYIFKYLDAPILNPDTVLSEYTDWHDISCWPMSSRVTEIIKKDAAKQADPLTKPGLIGAFCRAYSIEEAIAEFIPEYEPCDHPNRYTYTAGSSAAGVTVYDGKYSYSFHATDPASGQLCNAWDLVRLHKFSAMDEDTSKPVTARPSWQAMTKLVTNDSRVKIQLLDDRAKDFTEPVTDIPEDDKSWRSCLKFTQNGTIASTIDNAVQILERDPQLKGCLSYDEFNHNILAHSLPWRSEVAAWDDSDDSELRLYFERNFGFSGKEKLVDAVNNVAMLHKFHPVRDYLDSCIWDGVPRVDTLLIDYLGAEDNEYTRAVTRKTLAAAVARIYNPGCKFDYILTFRGKQGIGKSTLIRKLGGKWFTDSIMTMQGKEAYEQLLGAWLVEVGELAGMRKAEAETIKLFISKQSDRFRPAYGRRTKEYPRQCIFFGTTNESQFLRDTTGNRRFWPVGMSNHPALSVFDLDEATVAAIWGEAKEIYNAKEPLYLTASLEAKARAVQAEYEEENPKAGIILDYLERWLPYGWEDMDTYARRQWLETNEIGQESRSTVTAIEVYAEALNGNTERLDRYAIKEINDILCQLPNWQRAGDGLITVKPYGRQRYYRRVD